MKDKIKIMKTPLELTEEEIRDFMDFEALLKLKNKVDHEGRKIRRVRNLSIGFVGIVIIPIMIFLLSEKKSQPVTQPKDLEYAQAPLSPPVLTDSSTSDSEPVRSNAGASDVAKPGTQTSPDTKPKTSSPKETSPTKQQETIIQPVYVQAEPLDGYPSLYEYFNNHLVYPAGAVKDSVEGVVNVEFVIDTAGKATNIQIENSLGVMFDKEVVRLIRNMPLWKSASYNGKPVQSKISLPITFELKKISNP